MADKKITDLDPIATVQPTTVLIVVDNPTTTPTDKKATVSQLPIGDAQLTNNVALKNAPNAFTAPQTMTPPLGVASGGTGAASLAAHGVLVGEGAGAVVVTAPGAAGQILTSRGGALDPIFQSPVPMIVQDFRLGLTFGVPVNPGDVSGNVIAFIPYVGRRCTVFDSGGNATTLLSDEVHINVPATSNMFDVFAYNNGGVLALELAQWTNVTTRATAVVRAASTADVGGILVKAGDLTRRYVGSFCAFSGNVPDTAQSRCLWNYHNRVRRSLSRIEPATQWTYSTATWRYANGNSSNQVQVVVGIPEVLISMDLQTQMTTTGQATVGCVIGEDVVGAKPPEWVGGSTVLVVLTTGWQMSGGFARYPAVGLHSYIWSEIAAMSGSGAVTFFGTSGGFYTPMGMFGWIEA